MSAMFARLFPNPNFMSNQAINGFDWPENCGKSNNGVTGEGGISSLGLINSFRIEKYFSTKF